MQIEYQSNVGTEYLTFKRIIESALEFLIDNGTEISDSDSKGGYFSNYVASQYKSPHQRFIVLCGEVEKEKTPRYFYNSQEKPHRLNENIFTKGHTLSGQSANEEVGEYPGAVYIKLLNEIFSFSGLKALWDLYLSVLGGCVRRHLLSSDSSEKTMHSFAEIVTLYKEESVAIDAPNETLQLMLEGVEYAVNKTVNFFS